MRDLADERDPRIRVLVVDDHRSFADLLSLALNGEPDVDCVGVANSAAEAIDLAQRLQPDVVVMDIQMPKQDGIAATRRLREVTPGSAVVIVTAHRDPDWVVKAAQAGANAFVPKDGSLTEMLDAIRRAEPGAMLVSPSTFRAAAPAVTAPAGGTPPPALTQREREVLALMGQGMAPRAISRVLGISLHTCRGYVKTLQEKLGVRSQLEAVIRGQQYGLIDPPDER